MTRAPRVLPGWAAAVAFWGTIFAILAGLRTVSDHAAFAKNNDIVQLGRFYITCCVADSIPIEVEIDPRVHTPNYGKDTWLDVAGPIAHQHRQYVVQAERVQKVPQPRDPYLSFAAAVTQ